ncbi:hypothetical protein UCRPC4_g02695 [Phaeomoniella chlamydospora]|uniref:DUF1742-domain-containing protein n=1 Tax=Phaeomoniella chlamydospora TaxID=158046 RepID=A0A0G2EM97_PHACM|nr:hypothetical protein UCRPC4_g02695 [Phaeomoniella chlamydospora]
MENKYHLRTVADTASKACFICYKPTTKVLITPDNKDFFYVCPGHLTDKGFCTPVTNPDAEAAKRKREELEKRIAEVTAEYEEKQRRKKAKAKEKSKDDDKDKEKESKDSKSKDDDGDLEKEKNEKVKPLLDSQAWDSCSNSTQY